MQYPSGKTGGMRIMSHHHHGIAELLIQDGQKLEHVAGGPCIRIASWFIRQTQVWIRYQRAR